MTESRRIQFEFDAGSMARIDALKQQSGRDSYAHVVRDAVRLLEWYEAQIEAGYVIGLVKGDTLMKTVTITFALSK